jgi:hypothetical protein
VILVITQWVMGDLGDATLGDGWVMGDGTFSPPG